MIYQPNNLDTTINYLKRILYRYFVDKSIFGYVVHKDFVIND